IKQEECTENLEVAKDICDAINNARLVAVGVIPTTIEEIAYAPPGPGETPKFVDRPLSVYPNPGGVGPYRFSFSTPVSEQLRLEIYNVTGQRVATITRTLDVGDATLLWNGKTDAGGSLVPGVYFARLRTATGMKSVKFVHVR
ncbi:MAG: T9SS type A sorting domain-containing protein, partial [Candidatus Krumholzibacteria bacterium]|nr:T9SS type A sorting domain-containing protein [Candidatus Krumholzibacteria bacterium]